MIEAADVQQLARLSELPHQARLAAAARDPLLFGTSEAAAREMIVACERTSGFAPVDLAS